MSHSPSQDHIFDVPEQLAQALFSLAESLPDYEYYSFANNRTAQQAMKSQIVAEMPELIPFAERLLACLQARPYFCLLRGFELDERSWVLISLSLLFGRLRIHTGKTQFDSLSNSAEPVIIKQRSNNASLHTDGPHWQTPNDFTLLACVRPDQNGEGLSQLVDLDALYEWIAEDSALQALLHDVTVPFLASDDSEQTYYEHPIINEDKHLRYHLGNIEAAVNIGGAQIDAQYLSRLRRFDAQLNRLPQCHEFALQSQDILILNNRKTVHGRSPIRNVEISERYYVRTRVSLDSLDAS